MPASEKPVTYSEKVAVYTDSVLVMARVLADTTTVGLTESNRKEAGPLMPQVEEAKFVLPARSITVPAGMDTDA